MLLYYTGEDEKGGAGMKNVMTRKEAAGVMRVSVPTLRKFIEKHNEILFGKRIDIKKLEAVITEESEKALQKKGK